MCKTIQQKVKFKAPPAEIYEALVKPAEKIGARFRFGQGSGINVDLRPGRRVVRAWREPDYPEGVFSMAAIVLRPSPSGGTQLMLTHRGVPKELIPRTEERWRMLTWAPLRRRGKG